MEMRLPVLCIFLAFLILQISACPRKTEPHKITCKDLDEVYEFVEKLQETFAATTNNCDDPSLTKWYYSVRQSILKNRLPEKITEFYFFVKEDFASAVMWTISTLDADDSEKNKENLKQLHDDLSIMEWRIKEQIEIYWKKAKISEAFSDSAVKAGNLNGSLVQNSLSCESLKLLRDSFEEMDKEYKASLMLCDDLEKVSYFENARRMLRGPKKTLFSKSYVTKYITASDCDDKTKFSDKTLGENKFAICILQPMLLPHHASAIQKIESERNFRFVFRVMLKLIENLDVLKKKVDKEIAKRACQSDRFKVVGRKLCKNDMLYRVIGPVISAYNDSFSWFSKKTFPFYKYHLEELIDDVVRAGDNFISLSLGIDTIQADRAKIKFSFCQSVGENAKKILEYGEYRGVFIQLRLFGNTGDNTVLSKVINEPWVTMMCIPEILHIIRECTALQSLSLFTGQDEYVSGVRDLPSAGKHHCIDDSEDEEYYRTATESTDGHDRKHSCSDLDKEFERLLVDDRSDAKLLDRPGAVNGEDPSVEELKKMFWFLDGTLPCADRKIARSSAPVYDSGEYERSITFSCDTYDQLIVKLAQIIKDVTSESILVTTFARHHFDQRHDANGHFKASFCQSKSGNNLLDFFVMSSDDVVCHYAKEIDPILRLSKPLMILKPRKRRLQSNYFISDTMLEYVPT